MDQADSAPHILTVYGFLGAVFAFNALCFIPLGHLASRLMTRQPKLKSYSWNLTGSLLGILLFYCVSFLWAPPLDMDSRGRFGADDISLPKCRRLAAVGC